MSQAFGHIKKDILTNNNLSCIAKCIYSYLAVYANNKTGECFPSLDRILTELNLSKNSFYKYIKELEKAGVLKRYQRQNKSTVYKLMDHIIIQKQPESEKKEVKAEATKNSTNTKFCASTNTKFWAHNNTINNNNNINNNYCRSYYNQKKDDKSSSTTTLKTKKIISFLNKIAGTRYKVTQVIQQKIDNLISHGYTFDDIKQVIQVKVTQFKNKNKLFMTKPNILFDLNRFDDLLQESMSNLMPYTFATTFSQEKKVIKPEWEESEHKENHTNQKIKTDKQTWIKQQEQELAQSLQQLRANI